MASFSLNGAGDKRTFNQFKFTKETNLVVKVTIDKTSIIPANSHTIINDRLRISIVAKSEDGSTRELTKDLEHTLGAAAGQPNVTPKPLTPGSFASAMSVPLSGMLFGVVAKELEIVLYNGGADPIMGTIDVVEGQPRIDLSNKTNFTLSLDVTSSAIALTALDIPEGAQRFKCDMLSSTVAATFFSPPKCFISQYNTHASGAMSRISRHLSNSGEWVDINPNCVTLIIEPVDDTYVGLDSGCVFWELYH